MPLNVYMFCRKFTFWNNNIQLLKYMVIQYVLNLHNRCVDNKFNIFSMQSQHMCIWYVNAEIYVDVLTF